MAKITTTLGALVEAEPSLKKLLAAKLEPKVRYHALKLMALVAVETKHFWTERDAAAREFGTERDVNEAESAKGMIGTVFEVRGSERRRFADRLSALSEIAVTLAWGPLTTAMLEACTDLTGDVLLGCGPLYQLDPPEAAAQAAVIPAGDAQTNAERRG